MSFPNQWTSDTARNQSIHSKSATKPSGNATRELPLYHAQEMHKHKRKSARRPDAPNPDHAAQMPYKPNTANAKTRYDFDDPKK
jgi:hypothetical protein